MKKYIDMEEWNCISILKKDVDIVAAENAIYSMQMKEKNISMNGTFLTVKTNTANYARSRKKHWKN